MAVWFHRVSLHYCLPRSLGCERLGLCWNSGRRRESVHQPNASHCCHRLCPGSALLGISLLGLSPFTLHALSALSAEENALRGLGILSGAPSDSSQEPLFSVEILPWSLRGRVSREEGTREKRHLPAPGRHRQQLWFHGASCLGASEAIRPSVLCTRSQQTMARGSLWARPGMTSTFVQLTS